MAIINGTNGADVLEGGAENDVISAGAGNDVINGRGGSDQVAGGAGADQFVFDGDRFAGVNVSAPGRQFVGGEDFISDFDFNQDAYVFDAADFNLSNPLSFQSLDGTAPGAAIRPGANVIVLTNADDDGNAATPFNAGAAANQIAALTTTDGAGFFVYFNSVLNLNRLVFSENLNDPTADLRIISRQTDLTGQSAIDALASFNAGNFRLAGEVLNGGAGADLLTGFGGADVINGGAGNDTINAAGGNDTIFGGGGSDAISGGGGADLFGFAGDPFDGINVSAPGRQFGGAEDFISDFTFAQDAYLFDAKDFGVSGQLTFQSLDANAPGDSIRPGANVIVLTNSDNDGNAATPFNAGTAANQVAALVSTDGAGFVVYYNSVLDLNRVFYSTNLNDPTADIKIVSRHTDLTGQAAIDALASFGAANFRFQGETLTGGDGADTLIGFGGADTISGGAGADLIFGRGGSDQVTGGAGADLFAFDGDPFDGANVSAPGRQFGGAEDFISDFAFSQDAYLFDARDFGVSGELSFQSLDATAPGASIRPGANVIVLTNSDSDGNAATPFNAGTAANQVAALVSTDGAGFVVYYNSVLDLNRVFYSTNLNDPTADVKIVSRHTDLTGQAAIDALASFGASNFRFQGETLTGGDGADTLDGFGGQDVLAGGAGGDTLQGRGGNDTLLGQGGDDVLVGGSGRNVLNGGDGFDTVSFRDATSGVAASPGSSRAQANPGSIDTFISIEALEGSNFGDSLSGGNAADVLSGLAGDDVLSGGNRADRLAGDDGDDSLSGGNDDDTLDGGTGSDRLDGGNGDDGLDGGGGEDVLTGGNGGDALQGGAGEDTLLGGNGNDRLDGGVGDDSLFGGNGADVFVFTDAGGMDAILDFRKGQDRIDLSDLDANGSAPGLGGWVFVGQSAFTGVAGQLRSVRGEDGWRLEGDDDGDGVADFSINTRVMIDSTDLLLA